MNRFLETITFYGNDVLVPIERIKFINLTFEKDWIIRIVSDDGDWEEHFGKDEQAARERYARIKKVIGGLQP